MKNKWSNDNATIITSLFFILLGCLILLIGLGTTVYAETNVEISNNGDGAHSSVSIHNNVNTTQQSTSSTNSHTSVKITTNGQTKMYESDNNEDVSMESDDGTAKVNIKNSGTMAPSNSSVTPTSSMEDKKKELEGKKEKLKQKIKAKIEKQNEKKETFESALLEFLNSRFQFFHVIFSK